MAKKNSTDNLITALTELYSTLSPERVSRASAFGIVINTPNAAGVTLSQANPEATLITAEVLNRLGFKDRVTCDLW